MTIWTGRIFAPAALLILSNNVPSSAQDIPAEQPQALAANVKAEAADPLLQEFAIDRSNRMTVPVKINNGKTFPFIVDTGSERTVIANELAQYLNLDAGELLRLATISGPATVNSYIIDNLTTSTLSIDGIEAPGLKQSHLGAYGLLGIDSLQDNKVYLDLRQGTMQVLPSERKRSGTRLERGMIVVSAQRKAGRLILANARVNGIRVDIVIDTGAQSSMGNFKLRDILKRRDRKGDYQTVAFTSVLGDKLSGEFTQIRSIEVGGIDIKDLPITFSENYAMKTLGLQNRPAIFLGMDALGLFDKVVIDFANRRVSFELPKNSSRSKPAQFAAIPGNAGG